MTIPQNSIGMVHLKEVSSKKIRITKNGVSLKNSSIKNLETGEFELEAGVYSIVVSQK